MRYVLTGYWYDDEMNKDERGGISFQEEFTDLREVVNGAIEAFKNIDCGCYSKRDLTIEVYESDEEDAEMTKEIWVHDARDTFNFESFNQFKIDYNEYINCPWRK